MYSYLANSWVDVHKRKEEKQKIKWDPGPASSGEWGGLGGDSYPESRPERRGRAGAGGGRRREGDLLGTRTPPPATGRAHASRYLDQPQNVTAVGGGGRADHEFSHFLLLLFFPLRTKPLYLNSKRRWFLIRLPGASSSQSGWHHDPTKPRRTKHEHQLTEAATTRFGRPAPLFRAKKPRPGPWGGGTLSNEAPRPMRPRLLVQWGRDRPPLPGTSLSSGRPCEPGPRGRGRGRWGARCGSLAAPSSGAWRSLPESPTSEPKRPLVTFAKRKRGVPLLALAQWLCCFFLGETWLWAMGG